MQDHFLLRVMNLEQTLKSELDSSYWIWGLLIFLCLMGQVLCVMMLTKSDQNTREESEPYIPEQTQQNNVEQQPEQERLAEVVQNEI